MTRVVRAQSRLEKHDQGLVAEPLRMMRASALSAEECMFSRRPRLCSDIEMISFTTQGRIR